MWIYDRRYDPRREKRLEKKAARRKMLREKKAARRAAAALHSQTAKKADSVYRAALLAGVSRNKADAAQYTPKANALKSCKNQLPTKKRMQKGLQKKPKEKQQRHKATI